MNRKYIPPKKPLQRPKVQRVLPYRLGLPLLMGSKLPEDVDCRNHPDLCYTAMRVVDEFLIRMTRRI